MTDTVNVPRERIGSFLSEWGRRHVNVDTIYSLGWDGGRLYLTVSDLRAMLAAAPKAEPVEMKDPDTVEHYTDGSKVVLDGYTGGGHALGSWAKLTLRFIAADGTETVREYTADDVRQPEAPKVEQEPVGKVVAAHFKTRTVTVAWDRWPVKIGASVYTHPAPASDELLEAGKVYVEVSGLTGTGKSAVIGEIEIALKALGLEVKTDRDFSSEKNSTHADWQSALDMYQPIVVLSERNVSRAKHKGPQS